ncbi:type II toxin-antitoxin system VapC family toxin [Rhizobium tubonense]|uniref:VapC toxin family PIN domain ribonuclease n=1 Tax=Rhizobium tubonense TaxID=484088 RepID=A0A2W4CL10_9HYPH|nr:type II toxin-antitoxin system VapC family toxin [Rhizobium tubonense]PZM13559.1 VapC toxin family PIN domain ribonuclease [Rhizobium tubonense]
MYILDTNIVSELRRRKPHGAVVQWLGSVSPNSLYLAAITAGEIQAGIEITRKRDLEKADEIERWLDRMLQSISVLDSTALVFRKWAQLMDMRSDDLIEDCLIAATAIVHNMTVVTRNTKDFANFPVSTFNPFLTPPAHPTK